MEYSMAYLNIYVELVYLLKDKMKCCFVSVFVAVCFGIIQQAKSQSICFDCKHLDNPNECKNFHNCQAGQRCFKEVVETDNGTAEYNWGCASSELCLLENSIAGRRKRLSVERCYECCDGNFCNFGPCQLDYCSKVTCQQGASCRNTALKAVCDCPTGYTGAVCEIEIDECSSNPCQNGATCTDYVGNYKCTCLPGFTGTDCEIDIDECSALPCHNGATCIDMVNDFTCMCVPGYTGPLCDTDINECAISQCQYNSTCVDLVNDFRCICPPGITGSTCEINIDECANVTCQNGAVCTDYINRFECKCLLGFDGTFCENSLGRVCYSCEGVIDDISKCTNETLCNSDEECYTEHELDAPGVFTYNLGCVPTKLCSYLENKPTDFKRRNTRPVQLCYECCDTNGCNHHACADYT